ncbi:MAG: ornithine--oxo-acid transaminase [Pseudonocardiales bacterium]|nr:ornithine--oxo-acid transaminase [Pseudonocardiales bacterium]
MTATITPISGSESASIDAPELPAELERRFAAPTYAPLPVTLVSGEGAWVVDEDGRSYLDMLSGYSALNFGHRHPALVAAAHQQLDKLTLTSRAFHTDQLGPFCAELSQLCQLDGVVPMNTGAEAVETAIKAARRWGYLVKGVPADRARIVVADGGFHGRTTTIVGFSTDPVSRDHFGPYGPGFDVVPFGDLAATEAAFADDTVAILVEPIQGEAGVVIPPDGYLPGLRRLCDRMGVLLILDEVQSGLGRTGRTFACDHAGVRPDAFVLGKALGGGILPVSAFVARADIIGCFTPGSHGSTFGGGPLACAVGRAVLTLLAPGDLQRRATGLGQVLHGRLSALVGHGATAVRVRGLWAGVDLDPRGPVARTACELLLTHGVLAKDAHGHTLRLAPPLVIDEADLHRACDAIESVVHGLAG